jgi:hypothetical protein
MVAESHTQSPKHDIIATDQARLAFIDRLKGWQGRPARLTGASGALAAT